MGIFLVKYEDGSSQQLSMSEPLPSIRDDVKIESIQTLDNCPTCGKHVCGVNFGDMFGGMLAECDDCYEERLKREEIAGVKFRECLSEAVHD